ncbi:unnamed protein product [Effrenium voratum]|uniref:Uncharacterized protein n=2 Tax=Effrenium voratum TaxID=2562239 RepID=A0AA36I994_9DINO|nr:unnamed protein product [Effrenium voratum]
MHLYVLFRSNLGPAHLCLTHKVGHSVHGADKDMAACGPFAGHSNFAIVLHWPSGLPATARLILSTCFSCSRCVHMLTGMFLGSVPGATSMPCTITQKNLTTETCCDYEVPCVEQPCPHKLCYPSLGFEEDGPCSCPATSTWVPCYICDLRTSFEQNITVSDRTFHAGWVVEVARHMATAKDICDNAPGVTGTGITCYSEGAREWESNLRVRFSPLSAMGIAGAALLGVGFLCTSLCCLPFWWTRCKSETVQRAPLP